MASVKQVMAGCVAVRFERLPVEQVPPLWLMYSNSPSDSGAVHSPVKQRWLAGDADIIRDMAHAAALAEQGRYCLWVASGFPWIA